MLSALSYVQEEEKPSARVLLTHSHTHAKRTWNCRIASSRSPLTLFISDCSSRFRFLIASKSIFPIDCRRDFRFAEEADSLEPVRFVEEEAMKESCLKTKQNKTGVRRLLLLQSVSQPASHVCSTHLSSLSASSSSISASFSILATSLNSRSTRSISLMGSSKSETKRSIF